MQSNINLNQLIPRINNLPYWEIKDAFFNNDIANKKNYSNIEEALNELKEFYSGQEIIIKAGSLDKNGKFTVQAKSFNLILPQTNEEVINLNVPQVSNNTPYAGLGTVTLQQQQQQQQQQIKPQTAEELIKNMDKQFNDKLNAIIEKNEAQNLKLRLQLEHDYKMRELERREIALEENKKQLEKETKKAKKEADEYKIKKDRFIPETKDLLHGLAGFIKDFIPKNGNLQNTPTDAKPKKEQEQDFKITEITEIETEIK